MSSVVVLISRLLAVALAVAATASLTALWHGLGESPLILGNGAEAGGFRANVDVVRGTIGSDPALRRVRVGDRIDIAAVSRVDIYDVVMGTLERPVTYPLIDASGRRYTLILRPHSTQNDASRYVDATINTLTTSTAIFLAVLLLMRRPGAVTITFAIYCTFTIPTQALVQAIGMIGEPVVRSLLQSVAVLVTFYLGSFALVGFALRFPNSLRGAGGTIGIKIFDGVVVAISLAAVALNPYVFSRLAGILEQKVAVGCIVCVVIIVALRYAAADGATRSRLAWVLTGSLISAIAGLSQVVNWLPARSLGSEFSVLATDALPIAVAYAVLRHHIIDVGFAINRTLVYGILSVTILAAVGFSERLVEIFLKNWRVADGALAIVTVSLGLLLKTLHERIKCLVERVLFRERHAAARYLEARIMALDFAETATTVDGMLTTECCEILGLHSAAVFRACGETGFQRTATIGWSSSPILLLPMEHVVVRMARSQERTIVFADEGVPDSTFSGSDADPQIAVPITRRHRVLGFVLYGQRAGGEALDPAERALLERAATAAANAYDAIEAAEWRRFPHGAPPSRILPTGETAA